MWRVYLLFTAAGLTVLGGLYLAQSPNPSLTLRLLVAPAGFSSLSRIVSLANLRDVKRQGARVRWEDLEAEAENLVCLTGAGDDGLIPRLLRQKRYPESLAVMDRLCGIFGQGNVFVEVTRTLAEGEDTLSRRLFQLADHLRLPALATNNVRHCSRMGLAAHEALRRVALKLGPDEEHGELPQNGEAFLKSADVMSALFADRPDAIANAARLPERLAPPLDPDIRHYPRCPHLPPGESAFSYLAALTWQGAKARYGGSRKGEVTERLIHEIEVIRDLGYSDYFLICKDVCDEARKRGIGFALRGSAVGSAVAYCLGMSEHDPIGKRISFERFLSKARKKPPDIDVDFAHDQRDAIMEYTRKTYGEDKVAGVANYVTWRGRSLLRDLGKVLGFSGDETERLRDLLWHSRGDDLLEKLESQPEIRALGLDPAHYADLFALCASLAGLLRHLGTHSSGLVVADVPLASVCPITWAAKGTPIVTLDKDDVEAPGIRFVKMDQLCLRALTAISIAVGEVQEADPAFDYAGRDRDDPETLALIRAAQTVGVFQLESPAQMCLQMRLGADRFSDLVHSVALIRPGPLVGGGVPPYLTVRNGWKKPSYPLPELEEVLAPTFGRILFQDQVLEVVAAVGGYGQDEADVWLKAMTHARNAEEMQRLGQELSERAKAKGLTGRKFKSLWKQIQGFSRYGFCEGHAWAFADHAQGTAYLLRHYPAEFLAAVLSVEPCGFWPVATVAAEAVRRGVTVLPPCVNESGAREWRNEAVGEGRAIRCPLVFVQGVSVQAAVAIAAERERAGPFQSLADAGRRLWFLSRESLEWLVLAGALDSLCASRRQSLWALPAVHPAPQERERQAQRARAAEDAGQGAFPLEIVPRLPPDVPDFTESERFQREWQALGFSPSGHPMRFYREWAASLGAIPCAALQQCQHGQEVALAGLVLRPHRPPISSGEVIVYLTLEDESGLAQVTILPAAYNSCGADVFGENLLVIRGIAERRAGGVSLRGTATQPVGIL